jgi:hypothetical protein
MGSRTFSITLALWFTTAAIGNDAVKPFTGTWTAQGDAAKAGSPTWIFEEKGESLKIAEVRDGEKLVEFECNTKGRECTIQDGGKKATVSMWFNGPTLVELEVRGSEIVKRRFAVREKGDAMDMEIIAISPARKPDMLHLTRAQAAVQSQ